MRNLTIRRCQRGTLVIVVAMAAACVSSPGALRDDPYVFSVVPVDHRLDVTPVPADKKGLYKGGNARIKVNGSLNQTMEWQCPGDMVLDIRTLDWSDSDPSSHAPSKGNLTTKIGAEHFEKKDVLQITLAKPTHTNKGVAAYKYDLDCGGIKLDPIIIVDR